MFDMNQNGNVDQHEFLNMMKYILHHDSSSSETKDDSPPPLPQISKRLLRHFFGRTGTKHVNADQFCAWIESLKAQILRAEFHLYLDDGAQTAATDTKSNSWWSWFSISEKPAAASISMQQFAATLISSAPIEDLALLIPRVEAMSTTAAAVNGVTLREFCEFHLTMQRHFTDILGALSFTGTDIISVDQFIKATKVVSDVELDPALVRTLFRLFASQTDADGATIAPAELQYASGIACHAIYGVPPVRILLLKVYYSIL